MYVIAGLLAHTVRTMSPLHTARARLSRAATAPRMTQFEGESDIAAVQCRYIDIAMTTINNTSRAISTTMRLIASTP